MREENSRENLLSSWKEIAAFLDCHIRTCIRWEKQFGLPVHRMDSSQKSRVFAYKDEIERWQKECFKSENGYTQFYRKQRAWYKNPHIIYPGAILLAAVIFFLLLFVFPKAQQPYDFKIEKSRLILLSSPPFYGNDRGSPGKNQSTPGGDNLPAVNVPCEKAR